MIAVSTEPTEGGIAMIRKSAVIGFTLTWTLWLGGVEQPAPPPNLVPRDAQWWTAAAELPDLAACQREIAERLAKLRATPPKSAEITSFIVTADGFTQTRVDWQGHVWGSRAELRCLPEGVTPWPASR